MELSVLAALALTTIGLCIFEIVSSIDNAVINAEVLATMQEKYRRWFLVWGIFFAVFLVRGLLPWAIVWGVSPGLGPMEALMATFSSDPEVIASIEKAKPILLGGGGTFLLFLFFYWLFIEEKNYAFGFERFFTRHSPWFYTIVSLILCALVWFALTKIKMDMLAFGTVVGSTVFFITLGFKENAAQAEKELLEGGSARSDISKILYLEAIDLSFSIDGVLGAFAFTLSIPIILVGNGLGAIVVRQLTIKGVDKIKSYPYLKNGAMYSIFFLGGVMVAEAYGFHVPNYVSPCATILLVGYFFWRSYKVAKQGVVSGA